MLIQEREALYKASVVDYEITTWQRDLSNASDVRKDLKRLNTLKMKTLIRYNCIAEIDYTASEDLPTLQLHLEYGHSVKLDAPEFRLWPRPEFRLTSLIIGRDRIPSIHRIRGIFKEVQGARRRGHEPILGVIQGEDEDSFGAIFKHLEVFHFGSALISYDLLNRVLDVSTQLESLFVLLAHPESDEQPRLVARLDQSKTLTDLGIYFGELMDIEWPGHRIDLSDPVVSQKAIPSFPNALNHRLRTVRCFVQPHTVVRRHMATHKRGDCRKSRDKQIQGTRNPPAFLYLAVPSACRLPNPARFACALKHNLPPDIYPELESAADQYTGEYGGDEEQAFYDGGRTGAIDHFVECVNDLFYGGDEPELAGPECWTQ